MSGYERPYVTRGQNHSELTQVVREQHAALLNALREQHAAATAQRQELIDVMRTHTATLAEYLDAMDEGQDAILSAIHDRLRKEKKRLKRSRATPPPPPPAAAAAPEIIVELPETTPAAMEALDAALMQRMPTTDTMVLE